MKNKAIIGGIIALAIVGLIALFCSWVGRKINDRIENNDNTTTETRIPEGQKTSPPIVNTEQAQANLVVVSDSSFEAVIENIRKTSEKILSEKLLENTSEKQKICLIESVKIEKNVTLKVFHKIIESNQNQKIYELKVSVLDEYLEEHKTGINDMLESFVVT